MTSLTSDQQLVIPDYTEQADGPLDFYQFATGGLESRLIKRYASASDRTARNPTPQVNELSVRADNPGFYEYWSGSAWLPEGGKSALKLVKGIRITNTGGPIATTSGTNELDLAKYQIPSVSLSSGRYYEARYAVTFTKSVASDTFDIRLRVNTAVSGTQIGQLGFDITDGRAGGYREFSFIFVGDPSYTSIYLSVVRSAGSGTLSYYGTAGSNNRCWGELIDAGDPTLWSDIP